MALSVLFLAPALQKQNASLLCRSASKQLESGSSVRAMKPLESHKYPSAEALGAFLGPICGVKWGNLQRDACLRTDVEKGNKSPPFYPKSAPLLFLCHMQAQEPGLCSCQSHSKEERQKIQAVNTVNVNNTKTPD